MTSLPRTAAAAALALATLAAHAEPAAAPQGVVSLSSSATAEVAKDLMTLVLTTTREGQDSAGVQSQLKQALDTALAEARKAARPQQLEVQTGNFSLYPRYSDKGRINGWQGTAELVIEGRDMPAIGALAGRIGTMTIARVGYGLSRETRERVEGEVAAQAIGRFRAKAADYARQFGHADYSLREVSVSASEPPPYAPAPMLRAKAMSASADESLPVEAGKGTVSISVSGTVQMK